MKLLCLALIKIGPLGAATWLRVPIPLPGLCACLPIALAWSDDEAADVVRRMSVSERERLQTAALAVGRFGLPVDVTRRVLGMCFSPGFCDL